MGLTIGNSPLTNKIYIGTVKNNLWQKNKTECTVQAIASVCENVVKSGGKIQVLDVNGKPMYKIIVEEIK